MNEEQSKEYAEQLKVSAKKLKEIMGQIHNLLMEYLHSCKDKEDVQDGKSDIGKVDG